MSEPVERFLALAERRLEAGRALFDAGLFVDAVYMAGYGPECALKALILAQLPEEQQQRIESLFRGTAAHELDKLSSLLVAVFRRQHLRDVLEPRIVLQLIWEGVFLGDAQHQDARTKWQQLSDNHLRGVLSEQDLEGLRNEEQRRGIRIFGKGAEDFRFLSAWKTDMRYEFDAEQDVEAARADAARFFEAARAFVDQIKETTAKATKHEDQK